MRQLAVLAFVLLTACAGAKTPAQKVFSAQSNYNTGLAIAVAYKALPVCPATVICKKESIVKQLQDADNIAAPALLSAQNVVRHPELGNQEAAIAAAQAAVAALTKITSALIVKEKQ